MDNHNGAGPETPARLVANIIAAHRAKDREAERLARQKLEQRFGVKLVFAKELETKGKNHDDLQYATA